MLDRRDKSFSASIEEFWTDFAGLTISPFPAPDLRSVDVGEIPLGLAVNEFGQTAGQISLPLNSLTHHVSFFGTTGAGKTWGIVYLLAQVVNRGIPSWVFDWKGDITRYLLWLYGSDRINVFDLDTFRRNPLEADNWRKAMLRLRRPMREEYLRDGSLNLGSDVVKKLYTSDRSNPPAFADLYNAVEQEHFNAASRRAAYKESLQNRIGAWRDFIPAYSCSRGFPMAELLKQTCCFLIKGVPPDLANFFIKELVISVEAELMDSSEGKLQLIVAVDETHLLDSREMMNRNDVGKPLIRQVARSLRHCGVGLIIADQIAALVPNALIGLTNTKIAFLTPDGPSQLTLQQSMNLSVEQRNFLAQLGNQQAVVHSSAFSGTGALLMQVPQLNLVKASLSEVDAAKQVSASRFPWTPIEEHASLSAAPKQISNKARNKEHNNVNESPHQPRDPLDALLDRIGEKDLNYLALLRATPSEDATKRDAGAGIAKSTGSVLRAKLTKMGLIRAYEAQIVGHGGQSKLIEVTETGLALLAKTKRNIDGPQGRGSPLHKAMQARVASVMRKQFPGASVSIEDGDERAIDVLVRDKTETIGIEISISTKSETEIEHMKSNLNTCDRVVVLAETEAHLADIKELVASEFGAPDQERISFSVLNKYIAAVPQQASLP